MNFFDLPQKIHHRVHRERNTMNTEKQTNLVKIFFDGINRIDRIM